VADAHGQRRKDLLRVGRHLVEELPCPRCSTFSDGNQGQGPEKRQLTRSVWCEHFPHVEPLHFEFANGEPLDPAVHQDQSPDCNPAYRYSTQSQRAHARDRQGGGNTGEGDL
jgi:hypothetical protein